MNTRAGFVGPMYIQLSGVWHRFYIDAGCLFWAEGHAPEPEDDLLDGDIYVDLGESLHVIDTTVSSIRMADCELLVEFGNGGRLELREAVQDEGTRILEATPAPDVGSR